MQQQATGAYTNEGAADQLAALLASGDYAGAKLHLYKSSFSPTVDSKAADFLAEECDFTGYTAQSVTYSAVGTDETGTPTVLSNRVFFQATDAAAPNMVGGAVLIKDVTGPPATHTAVGYYQLPAPIALNVALAFVGVVLTIVTPQGTGLATFDF